VFNAYKCKSFRFESYCLSKEGFLEVVNEAWNGGEAKDVRNPICLINKRTETNCQGLAKLEHKEVSR
jgi:hypothetical protein